MINTLVKTSWRQVLEVSKLWKESATDFYQSDKTEVIGDVERLGAGRYFTTQTLPAGCYFIETSKSLIASRGTRLEIVIRCERGERGTTLLARPVEFLGA